MGMQHGKHAAFCSSQKIPALTVTPCLVSAPKQSFANTRSKLAATSIPASQASSAFDSGQLSQVATLSQYDDCELLLLQYGRQLSLSKSAIYWSLQVPGRW
jgi:hypothetical protein